MSEREQKQPSSEEKYRSLVANIRDVMWTSDEHGRTVFISPNVEQVFGYTPEEIYESAGNQWLGRVHPDDVDGLKAAFGALFIENKPFDVEYRIQRKDGRWIWLHDRSVYVYRKDGVEYADGVFTDVTKRKHAEEALQTTETRLRLIADTIEDVFWITDWAEHRIIYASSAYEKIWGRSLDELYRSSSDWADTIHPDDRQHVWDTFLAMEEGEQYDEEYRVVRPDGSERWIRDRGYPIRDESGQIWHAVGIAQDITERRCVQEALGRSEEFLNATGRMAKVGGWEVDVETRQLRWTEETYRIHQVPLDYKPVLDEAIEFYHPEDRPKLERAIERAIEHGEPYDIEVRLITAKGDHLWTHSICKPHVVDGKTAKLTGTFQDITERKQAEEERLSLERQVQQAQKLESLGVLAGGIAHDFNNLLMAILGNADLALRDLSPHAPARDSVREIVKASRRAAELAKQMLAYSGKGRFVIEPIGMNEFVEEMSHLLEVSVSKKVSIKYNFADSLPVIEGDATQVRQVIMNLITNASEAIGDNSGIISISTDAIDCDSAYLKDIRVDEDLPEGTYVYLEVADTGCGMDEETRARVFDPFFTTKFTGRGLGMAAVLGILRGHSGTIKIYSEPGRGSTVKVLFPVSDKYRGRCTPLETGEAGAEALGPPMAGTVLLADDEASIRAVGRRMLEKAGLTVLTASDGREVLDIFRDHADDIVCVILDLTMPHMDGEETFRELRRMDKSVRVVISSGYNEEEITQRFAGKGLTGFIQKPYQIHELTGKLRQILES